MNYHPYTFCLFMWIQIDEDTGVISVAYQANFEKYKSIQFTVHATDGKHEDTATVIIDITDANDIRPMFKDDFINTEVPSYAEIGTVIAQVSAYDNDTGEGYDCLSRLYLTKV